MSQVTAAGYGLISHKSGLFKKVSRYSLVRLDCCKVDSLVHSQGTSFLLLQTGPPGIGRAAPRSKHTQPKRLITSPRDGECLFINRYKYIYSERNNSVYCGQKIVSKTMKSEETSV